MTSVPDYADFMTLKEFKACVKNKSITPWDGSGYWATFIPATATSPITKWMEPEGDVFKDQPPYWATHVAWFNK